MSVARRHGGAGAVSGAFSGLSAAPGIGIGYAWVYRHSPTFHAPAECGEPEQEWRAFERVRDRVDAELEHLSANENRLVAEIFAAHRAILHDPTFTELIRREIFEERRSAGAAAQRATNALAEQFQGLDDDYFASRASDILDLGNRLLTHLGGRMEVMRLAELRAQSVLIAEDLTPTDLTQLAPDQVVGIALAGSTPTAHSAILARAYGIPMICALGSGILQLAAEAPVIVDGSRGLLIARPTLEEEARYQAMHVSLVQQKEQATRHASEPAAMRDGTVVPVYANANSPSDVAQSAASGADGIGLLRTEYLFRGRTRPPSLEEQTRVYGEFLRQVRGQLTVRALDAGGDKPVSYISHAPEENPFLGLRGVRLLIDQPELLRTQVAALHAAARMEAGMRAQAGTESELRFMLPMISTVEEVQVVRELLADWLEGSPLKLGVLIEVPSAALTAGVLEPLVDFFSIGTNDLAQYALASDRTNSTVARLADPLHPAVLHLIRRTCETAQAAGKPVSICGEIGGDPAAVPLLLGLGVTELSVPLPAVALVKERVRECSPDECARLAEAALRCGTAQEVRELLAIS